MQVFDLNDVYKGLFGYVAPPFPAVLIQEKTFPVPAFPGVASAIPASNEGRSEINFQTLVSDSGVKLRLPVMLRPAFKKYTSDDEGWVQLPNEPIMSLRTNKNIVITTVNRGKRKGDVIEEINLGGWQIGLEGIIYNDEGDYPESEVSQLRQLLEEPGSLEIKCLLAKVFGIKYVVIKQAQFDRREGQVVNLVTYSLGLQSDEDFDLEQIGE